MSTSVAESANSVIRAANQHYRLVELVEQDVVAYVAKLVGMGDEQPRAGEDPVSLKFGEGGIEYRPPGTGGSAGNCGG